MILNTLTAELDGDTTAEVEEAFRRRGRMVVLTQYHHGKGYSRIELRTADACRRLLAFLREAIGEKQ